MIHYTLFDNLGFYEINYRPVRFQTLLQNRHPVLSTLFIKFAVSLCDIKLRVYDGLIVAGIPLGFLILNQDHKNLSEEPDGFLPALVHLFYLLRLGLFLDVEVCKLMLEHIVVDLCQCHQ